MKPQDGPQQESQIRLEDLPQEALTPEQMAAVEGGVGIGGLIFSGATAPPEPELRGGSSF